MLAGADDGVQHRRGLTAHFAPNDAPSIAAKGDRSKRSLAQVVVQGQEALVQVSLQRIPVVRCVPERTPQRRLRQRTGLLLAEPLRQFLPHRLGVSLSQLAALLFTLPPCSRCTGSSDGDKSGGNARSIAYNLPISSSAFSARWSPASLAATNLRRACATQHTCLILSSPYNPSYWASASDWK